MAHELRTPLTPMTMLLQTLERKARNGTLDVDSIIRARRQVLRLTKLMVSWSILGRLNGDRLAIERNRFDLAELVTEVVSSFRATTQKHELRLTIHDVPVYVIGDRTVSRASGAQCARTCRASPPPEAPWTSKWMSDGMIKLTATENRRRAVARAEAMAGGGRPQGWERYRRASGGSTSGSSWPGLSSNSTGMACGSNENRVDPAFG